MKFDFLQQIWKNVTPLLQIMIDPSDNACVGQLFSFRLRGKNVRVYVSSMLDSNASSVHTFKLKQIFG